MTSPIRVATAALSGRIFAGRPTKDGTGFKEPRYDVTSDVLVAVRDKIGIGNQVNVERNGIVEFRIAILPPEDTRHDTIRFPFGASVRKVSGPEWQGVVVGYYSSSFTPEGLVIECTAPGARGQVHVEPAKRMERNDADA